MFGAVSWPHDRGWTGSHCRSCCGIWSSTQSPFKLRPRWDVGTDRQVSMVRFGYLVGHMFTKNRIWDPKTACCYNCFDDACLGFFNVENHLRLLHLSTRTCPSEHRAKGSRCRSGWPGWWLRRRPAWPSGRSSTPSASSPEIGLFGSMWNRNIFENQWWLKILKHVGFETEEAYLLMKKQIWLRRPAITGSFKSHLQV